MFVKYSDLEERIFNKVKAHFEKLPSIASDDYKNGFSDLIAQYGSGGQDYLGSENMFEDVIESTILDTFEKFDPKDKAELQLFYEKHFLINYYDAEDDEYQYSEDDLAMQIAQRFKSWMDDNFSTEDLTN